MSNRDKTISSKSWFFLSEYNTLSTECSVFLIVGMNFGHCVVTSSNLLKTERYIQQEAVYPLLFLVSPIKVLGYWKQLGFSGMGASGGFLRLTGEHRS